MTAAAQGISPFIPSVVAERRGRSTRESSPASITLNLSLVLLLAAASACSGSGDGDAGFQLPPDNCNSEDEAISDPQCALTLGEERVGYIHPPASPGVPDLDYYRVQLPAALSPRTLLHVTAGFSAPSTPVNLSVNVLKQKGTSLAKKVDLHGQGAPKIVDIVIPVTEPGASLTLILRDETPGVATPPYDAKNGYTLKVEVLENPDGNEPNDTAPTQIALTPQGDGQVGQELGYLATDNDVDLFEVSVPPGDQVLWMRISAPKQTPQANYRLRYTLLKDNGTTNPVPISEGWVANEFLPVDLGTARLASAGKYFIRIDGYRPANSNQPIPGDVRLQYTLDVVVVPEVDGNEPNDDLAQATVRTLNLGASPTTFNGRLGYVPDRDWYAVDVPASGSPTLLSYRLREAAGGGRFPATPGFKDRQVLLFTQVASGATAQERAASCIANAAVCPKGYAPGDTALKGAVEGYCGGFDPPRCLQSQRQEADAFTSLKNFDGLIHVPARGATTRYFFVVQDERNDFADDKDYSLEVAWKADPGETTGVPTSTLASVSSASFPVPPAGSTVLSGTLSFGHGEVVAHKLENGEGVRGPFDYDAYPVDRDRFELTFPSVAAPEDKTWLLQWDIQPVGGNKVADLAVELEFCDGEAVNGGGMCVPVTRSSGGSPLVLAFDGRNSGSWHNRTAALGELLPLWTRTPDGVTVTAAAPGCFCFERRFIKGGKFYLTVVNVDRKSYEIPSYTLRTALTDYPQSYMTPTKTIMCPAPVPGAMAGTYTGGCRFTQQ